MAVIFNFPVGTTIGPVKRRSNKEQIDRIIEKFETLVREVTDAVEACRTLNQTSDD